MYDILLCISSCCIKFLLVLIVLTVIASCEVVRYHVKFTFFTISSAIAATVCIPLMLPRIRDWRNALLPAWWVKKCGKILGITYRIRGKENIVQDSGSIVLINHQSAIDLCVLGELWGVLRNCTTISKKEVLYLGSFGLASWLWGTIFIDRKKGQEAQSTVNATGDVIRNKKMKLIIYPEGHRHSGQTLQPLKKGAFHVAIATQSPIQPVVVSRYFFLNSKLKKFNSGMSYITILPPISTKGLTKEDLPMLMEKTYEIMNENFVKSSQETLNEYVNSLQAV